VTLIATPDAAGATFGAWSDPSCPPGPVCTVRVDGARRQVDGRFSPQRFELVMAAPAGATVTSSPPGILCTSVDGSQQSCQAYFPLFTKLELAVTGPQPIDWDHRCERVVGTTCHVTVQGCTDMGCEGPSVSIGGSPRVFPAVLRVRFHVRSAGGGSGTIRSASLNCGHRCSTDLDFGDVISLNATADPGSHFVRWAEACSSQPTCQLEAGPVTGVTGIFERDTASNSGSGTSLRKPRRPSGFVANLSRVTVRGRGRARVVVLPLDTNAAADVWATLTRKGRSVRTGQWRVGAGFHLLRWRIPTRVRRGRYEIGITVRKVGGAATGFIRDIRLPR
jgi:List-Bact-rpt repeat protein